MTSNPYPAEPVLFIDTNAFIQLRDLKDLPWAEVLPGVSMVRLMISRPVIEELDRFKSGTNARRRKRARLALKLVDEASQQASKSLMLKEAPVQIILELAPRARPNWEELEVLDPASPDDRLVAAAHAFGNNAIIFSYDSGPRIAARDIGLAALVPPEEWLLPPEQSDEQRKIGKLETQLKALQDSRPKLKIAFPQADDSARIILYRPQLPVFDQAEAARLTKLYLQDNPQEEVPVTIYPFGRANFYQEEGFSQENADQYRNDYIQFSNKVAEYFQELHETLYRVGLAPSLQFKIENAGGGSAQQLIVFLETKGDIGLLAGQNDIESFVGSSALPEPPDLPKQRSVIPLFHNMPTASPNKPRDPTGMYWYDRPELGGFNGSYGCENFRPGEVFNDTIGILPQTGLPAEGILTVKAGANDLSAISASVDIRIENMPMDWHDDAVFELLPKFVQDNLKL